MMLASAWMISGAVAAILLVGGGVAYVMQSRRRQQRLAVWKQLKNGLTPDQVRAILGEPRTITPVEDGQKWDYGSKPGQASVLFTFGTVSGYVKPF